MPALEHARGAIFGWFPSRARKIVVRSLELTVLLSRSAPAPLAIARRVLLLAVPLSLVCASSSARQRIRFSPDYWLFVQVVRPARLGCGR